MLKYKVKNLIDAIEDGEVDVIAHQANCFHTMGAGVAKALSQKYPDLLWVDKAATSYGDANKLGDVSGIFIHPTKVVFGFNLYSQYGLDISERQTDYIALKSCLGKMKSHIDRLQEDGLIREHLRIGLPRIGAGLGGGDWEIISEIIEEELCDLDVTVYVLTEKDVPALA